jgi:intron-binding protein aquarius
MQYMQYYVPPANELPPAAPENIADVIPPENGSVLNQPKEHMAMEENGGGSDTTVSNRTEEDAVEAKDETMQEGNKMGEGNGHGDVAADKGDERADANDKMEEGDAPSKDKIEEENSEPSKDKIEEENSESKDKMDEE